MDKQSPKIKSKVAALVEEAKKVKVESIKGAKVITDREQALALTADKAGKELALAKRKSAAKKATKKKAAKAKKTVKKAVKKTTKRKATKKKSKR